MNRAVNYGLSKMQEMLGASGLWEEVAVGALCVPGCEHAPARAAGFALGMLVKRCEIPGEFNVVSSGRTTEGFVFVVPGFLSGHQLDSDRMEESRCREPRHNHFRVAG